MEPARGVLITRGDEVAIINVDAVCLGVDVALAVSSASFDLAVADGCFELAAARDVGSGSSSVCAGAVVLTAGGNRVFGACVTQTTSPV